MDWLLTFADPSIDWGYALVGLVVRFIGVFAVMAVMQIALQVSARVVQRIERPAAPDASGSTAPVPAALAASGPTALAEPAIAAIGLALAREARPTGKPSGTDSPSSWAIAGRMQQFDRRPRS